MAVVCPQNAYPGAYLKLTTPPPDMHPIKVRVPQNIKPGMSFQIHWIISSDRPGIKTRFHIS